MDRLFQDSVQRKPFSLNGQWLIKYDRQNQGHSGGYQTGRMSFDDEIYVPSCWNFQIGRYDYTGPAWYCKKFSTDQTKNSRFIFDSVSGQATVYLDGAELGGHYGSYTRFQFDVPSLKPGEHTLVVRVDNTVNDVDTMPLKFVDWYVYGGIYRPVKLEQFDDVSIDRIHITTEWRKLNVNKVTVKTVVKNWTHSPYSDEFELYIDSQKTLQQKVTIPALSTQEVVFELEDFKPQLWDTESPKLYSFQVKCRSDDLIERSGFRKIETSGRKILLNGREIFIKGVNRHNDNPELGYAINGPLIQRDMQIIKDLGANAIRGSHYPNDPLVLDYCDQMGFLFWEEIPFWNHPAESLASPVLETRARLAMREMIERDFNHPSIIFWSIQNESKSSSQEGLALFSKLASDIRMMDSSRLVTFASACGKNDICFNLVDVICWNTYPGWYDDDEPLDSLDTRFTQILLSNRQWLDEQKQDKPYIISEFGASALLGVTTFDEGRRWTENYQQKLLTKAIKALVESKTVQGFFIWQFCDGRTALNRKVSIGRPRTFNNKGLVDEHRNPKLAYYSVRDMLRDIPTYA